MTKFRVLLHALLWRQVVNLIKPIQKFMKKIAVIIFFLMQTVNIAIANDGPYIGIDVSRSQTNHLYKVIYKDQLVRDDYGGQSRIKRTQGQKSSAQDVGFGANAGFKIGIDEAFIAPEIFYDQINNAAKDFFPVKNPATRLEVTNRFGAKMNMGYNIYDRLDFFAIIGVANVKYAIKFRTDQSSHGVYKLSPIYGLGFSYDISDNFALKFTYDRQVFNAQYVYEGVRDKITLDVLKGGIVVTF